MTCRSYIEGACERGAQYHEVEAAVEVLANRDQKAAECTAAAVAGTRSDLASAVAFAHEPQGSVVLDSR